MLDTAFEALKKFDWGSDLAALNPIEDAAIAAHEKPDVGKDLETRLVAALQSELSLDAQEYVCRKLAMVGTAAAVPSLAVLLVKQEISHMARFALERIPAAEALQMGFVNRVVPEGEHLQAAVRAARHVAAIDPELVRQTKRAINGTFDIMGMAEALQASLDIDLQIESEGSPDKRRFFEIARSEGLQAAFAWRDSRFP